MCRNDDNKNKRDGISGMWLTMVEQGQGVVPVRSNCLKELEGISK